MTEETDEPREHEPARPDPSPADSREPGGSGARPSRQYAEGPAEQSGELPVAPASLGEVGGYELRERLGAGGMGTVYSALDADGVTVALKRIHPHVAEDPSSRARLAREVALLGRVRHDGVARVLDAEIDGQEAFLVTELVDGPTLEADVRTHGPFAADELSGLAHGLGDALEAIHAQGIVHRDLKPSNVMLASRGPVLIDFGIAQVVDDSRLTQAGMVTGTPGYVDPELIAGAEPDQIHDWWAWAAVLLFAATGHPPFGSGTMATVLARVTTGNVDATGAPPMVARALAAALHPDPAARLSPADVLQVIDGLWSEEDLERATRALPVAPAGTAVFPGSSPARPGEHGPARPGEHSRGEADHGGDGRGGEGDRGDDLRPSGQEDGAWDGAMPPSFAPTGEPHAPVRAAADANDRGGSHAAGPWAGAQQAWHAGGAPHGPGSAGWHPGAEPSPWGAGGSAQQMAAYPSAHPGAHPGAHPAQRPGAALPAWVLEPRRRPGTVTLIGAALTPLAAARPGVAAVVALVVLILLGALGTNGSARRSWWRARGRQSGDAAKAIARSPWDLVLSALALVLGALFALAAGLLAYYVGDGLFADSAHRREWTAWLTVGAALVTVWLTPSSAPQRRGAREVLQGIGRTGRRVAVLAALVAGALGVAWILSGGVTSWAPLSEPVPLGELFIPGIP